MRRIPDAIRTAAGSVLLVALWAPHLLQAQAPQESSAEPPRRNAAQLAALSPAARPGDVSSPRALILALHASVTGRMGSMDWSRLRSLFLPGARIGEAGSETSPLPTVTFVSVDDEIRALKSLPPDTVNREQVLTMHIEQYGSIASAFYAHRESSKEKGKVYTESLVNTAEMIFDGKRWWITCTLFNSSPVKHNIPKRLEH